MNSSCPVLWPFWRHNLHWLPSYYPQFSMTSFKMTVCIKVWNNFFKIFLFCIPMQLIHFDCVNGFLNSIKEIIWQTEVINRCPLNTISANHTLGLTSVLLYITLEYSSSKLIISYFLTSADEAHDRHFVDLPMWCITFKFGDLAFWHMI